MLCRMYLGIFQRIVCNPKKVVFGDGYKGLKESGPFQAILVTAGAPSVPKALLSQLKIGGRLVIPLGEKEQIMTRYVRKGEKDFDRESFGEFRFVPMLKNRN